MHYEEADTFLVATWDGFLAQGAFSDVLQFLTLLLHLESEKGSFWAAGGRCFISFVLVKPIAAFVQRVYLRFAFLFIVIVFAQTGFSIANQQWIQISCQRLSLHCIAH